MVLLVACSDSAGRAEPPPTSVTKRPRISVAITVSYESYAAPGACQIGGTTGAVAIMSSDWQEIWFDGRDDAIVDGDDLYVTGSSAGVGPTSWVHLSTTDADGIALLSSLPTSRLLGSLFLLLARPLQAVADAQAAGVPSPSALADGRIISWVLDGEDLASVEVENPYPTLFEASRTTFTIGNETGSEVVSTPSGAVGWRALPAAPVVRQRMDLQPVCGIVSAAEEAAKEACVVGSDESATIDEWLTTHNALTGEPRDGGCSWSGPRPRWAGASLTREVEVPARPGLATRRPPRGSRRRGAPRGGR